MTARIFRLDISIEPKMFPSLDNLATRILDRIRPEIVAELLLLQETALLSGLPTVSESTRCQWCNMKARFVVDGMTLCKVCTRIASNMKVATRAMPMESFRL